jgi:hypothetical protein
LLLVRIRGGCGVFGNNPFLQDDLDADLPFGIYPRRPSADRPLFLIVEYPDNRRVRQSIPFVVTLSIREHQPRFRCTALRAHRVQQPPQQPNGASKPSPSRRCDPRLTLKGGINIRGGPRHGRQSNPQCLVPSCPIALARPTRGEARIMPAGTAARWRCACHCRPLVAGLLAHRRMRYNPIRPGLGHSAPAMRSVGHASTYSRRRAPSVAS